MLDSPLAPDERWYDVLDRLEEGLAEALSAMDQPAIPFSADLWIPPEDMGSLPHALQGRVEKLIAAKSDLMKRMVDAQDGTIRRLAAMASVPKQSHVNKPVYLDVSG